MNYIVDDRASWYLQFFSSWCYAVGSGLIGAKFIAYQDLIADKPGTIGSICAWYGLAKSGDEIAAAIDRVENAGGTRFNKGVVGRGLQAFSEAQRSKIAEMARRHYPSVDFSPIGLAR
jgi:hypothetical protein